MTICLIVYPAQETDDLKIGGLPLAKKYEDSDSVVLIDNEGRARVAKGDPAFTDNFHIVCLKNDPLYESGEIFKNMKRAYEVSHPDLAHMSHVAVGHWMFYYFVNESAPIDRFNESDIKYLRHSAQEFIEHGFWSSPRKPVLNYDGSPKLDCATETISSANS